MELKKKTEVGILSATYKADSEYPGIYIDLKPTGEKDYRPLVTVEYNPHKECVCVSVWNCVRDEEPSHIIPVEIN